MWQGFWSWFYKVVLIVTISLLTTADQVFSESLQKWEAYGFTHKDLMKASPKTKSREVLGEISSLLISYPHEIKRVIWRDNDWVLIFNNGQELYWAQGRLLPKSLRTDINKYRKYISYRYPEKIPDPATFSVEMVKKMKSENTKEKRANMPAYEGTFYELLYGNHTRASLEAQLVRINFLGRRISVHRKVQKPLATINQKIQNLSKRNSKVARFMQEIRSVQCYAWRRIRGSTSMSFHSVAVAVDILPRNRQKIIYWGWEADRNPNWPVVPLKDRWIPPSEVIKIFEDHDFIWGGRWILYDNMHFEYRPELLALNRLDK